MLNLATRKLNKSGKAFNIGFSACDSHQIDHNTVLLSKFSNFVVKGCGIAAIAAISTKCAETDICLSISADNDLRARCALGSHCHGSEGCGTQSCHSPYLQLIYLLEQRVLCFTNRLVHTRYSLLLSSLKKLIVVVHRGFLLELERLLNTIAMNIKHVVKGDKPKLTVWITFGHGIDLSSDSFLSML